MVDTIGHAWRNGRLTTQMLLSEEGSILLKGCGVSFEEVLEMASLAMVLAKSNVYRLLEAIKQRSAAKTDSSTRRLSKSEYRVKQLATSHPGLLHLREEVGIKSKDQFYRLINELVQAELIELGTAKGSTAKIPKLTSNGLQRLAQLLEHLFVLSISIDENAASADTGLALAFFSNFAHPTRVAIAIFLSRREEAASLEMLTAYLNSSLYQVSLHLEQMPLFVIAKKDKGRVQASMNPDTLQTANQTMRLLQGYYS